jgi:hypothetical protein
VAAAGQTGAILGLAVLFAFLFLVGLYESWIIPVPFSGKNAIAVAVAAVGMWATLLRCPSCPQPPRRAHRPCCRATAIGVLLSSAWCGRRLLYKEI